MEPWLKSWSMASMGNFVIICFREIKTELAIKDLIFQSIESFWAIYSNYIIFDSTFNFRTF